MVAAHIVSQPSRTPGARISLPLRSSLVTRHTLLRLVACACAIARAMLVAINSTRQQLSQLQDHIQKYDWYRAEWYTLEQEKQFYVMFDRTSN